MEMLAWALATVSVLLTVLFFLPRFNNKEGHPDLLAERNPNPILCINRHYQVAYANSSAKRFLKRLGFVSNSYRDLLPEKYSQMLQDLVTSRQGGVTWEYLVAAGIMFEAQVYFFSDIDTFHVYISDVTQKKLAENELIHQAYHDPITSLPNQRMLHEELHKMLISDRERAFALISLGISHIEQLEEGMAAGEINNLIIRIARRLNGALERNEPTHHLTQLYRTENYRFVIIVDELTDQKVPLSLISELQSCFISPFTIARHQHYISCGIGITFHPNDARDAEELVRNANSAMSSALRLGNNSLSCYSPEMNVEAMKQLSLETDLRKALVNNELSVNYQPQLRMEDRMIVGAEALIRWDHPIAGPIPPARFIPLAEEIGLIVPITNWILDRVCNQIAIWQKEGIEPVPVAINISAQHFVHDHLTATVENAIRTSGISPSLIELEITERVTLLNVEMAIEALEQLKDLGVSLAVDDFGTGYSSLSYLQQLPLDVLKIDQAFVHRLGRGESSSNIVRAIVGLGRNLGLKLIAEGVETKEQFDLLREIGCEFGQGYLFSHPVSTDEFTKILELEALDKKGS